MVKKLGSKMGLSLSTAALGPRDGVMVLILREDGGREIHFPQLGLISEGRIEQSVPFMYREVMKARVTEGRDLTVGSDDEEDEDA